MGPDSDHNDEYGKTRAARLENGNARVGPEERCRETPEPAQLATKVWVLLAYDQCENWQHVAKELDLERQTRSHPFPYRTLNKCNQKKQVQYEARHGDIIRNLSSGSLRRSEDGYR
jgi:hypothetical protein